MRKAFQGPPASDWSGFSIPVKLSPGLNSVRLEARVGGRWAGFHTIPLRVPWSAWGAHAFRSARFWPGIVLGRPNTLGRLPEWEQEFILGRIEQGAGHSLKTGAHHAPREVEAEHFPRSRTDAGRLPKLTVVTPSFNQGRYLDATIRSVLGQEGVRLDYIVRDGGSSDGSGEIVKRHAPRLKAWATEPDGGQADAVRRGFAAAECGPDDVMAYVNSDDVLMPGAARFVAEYLARHPRVDVVFGHRVLVDDHGREVGRWLTPRRSFLDLRIHDFIPQETLFWRRRIWDRVGGIDAGFQYSADWDLLLRFAAAGARFHRLPWFLGQFRIHPAQKTATQAAETGVREETILRQRSLGRQPTRDEIDADRKRAQVESAFLATLWRRGWRV